MCDFRFGDDQLRKLLSNEFDGVEMKRIDFLSHVVILMLEQSRAIPYSDEDKASSKGEQQWDHVSDTVCA